MVICFPQKTASNRWFINEEFIRFILLRWWWWCLSNNFSYINCPEIRIMSSFWCNTAANEIKPFWRHWLSTDEEVLQHKLFFSSTFIYFVWKRFLPKLGHINSAYTSCMYTTSFFSPIVSFAQVINVFIYFSWCLSLTFLFPLPAIILVGCVTAEENNDVLIKKLRTVLLSILFAIFCSGTHVTSFST